MGIRGESSPGVVLVSIDLETTGFSFVKDHIIQVGAVAVRLRSGQAPELERIGEFDALVKTTKKIKSNISKLTGITNAMVAQDGLRPTAAFARLCRRVYDWRRDGSEVILVGHNIAQFDLPFLMTLGVRTIGTARALRFDGVLDTLKVLKPLKVECGGSLKLGQVYRVSVGRELVNAHSAVADAQAVVDILASPWWEAHVGPLSALAFNATPRQRFLEDFRPRFQRLHAKHFGQEARDDSKSPHFSIRAKLGLKPE